MPNLKKNNNNNESTCSNLAGTISEVEKLKLFVKSMSYSVSIFNIFSINVGVCSIL